MGACCSCCRRGDGGKETGDSEEPSERTPLLQGGSGGSGAGNVRNGVSSPLSVEPSAELSSGPAASGESGGRSERQYVNLTLRFCNRLNGLEPETQAVHVS